MRLFRLFFLVASFVALTGTAAQAHAIVLRSTPQANASVSGQGLAIEIRFNSRIDAGRSHLKIFAREGEGVSLPLADSTSEDTLKAQATGLAPGSYRLHWQTLSPDGHISQGDIPFRVDR